MILKVREKFQIGNLFITSLQAVPSTGSTRKNVANLKVIKISKKMLNDRGPSFNVKLFIDK